MKLYLYNTLFFVTVSFSNAIAQTASGIINSYFKVTNFIPAYNGVRVQSITGLAVGNRVMIIQMKGAAISGNNNSSFGSITDDGGTGKYEFATICSFLNDTVVFERALINTYDYTQAVQLVYIPQYTNLTITGTLQAQAWDETAGTGGVIALRATGTITLNANIDASGVGYKGGELLNMNGNCNFFGLTPVTDYYFAASSATTTANGAKKGEGIASYITNREYGRGKQANGGGGGNALNTGGGGGGNYGAGGGGGIKNGGGCNTSNPGGVGGVSISSYGYSLANNRIFAGGGGGAGQENNNEGTPGGNGGGIIFIQCDELIGNNYSIMANGKQGENPTLTSPYVPTEANGDGGGGGGAGGTVLLNINSYTGNVSVQAKGADGGKSGFLAQCPGPGGGGGGGFIWSNTSLPLTVTTNVAGGVAGIIKDSPSNPSCELTSNGAAAGGNGSVANNFTVTEGTVLSCALLPIPSLIEWYGKKVNEGVLLEWKMNETNTVDELVLEKKSVSGNFYAIKKYPQPADGFYHYTDYTTEFPASYRLMIKDQAGKKEYSNVLFFAREKVKRLNVYPNPVQNELRVALPFAGTGKTAVSIFDVNGKQVLTHEITQTFNQQYITIPVVLLPAGIYTVKCYWKDELYIAKIVKQ